MKNPDYSVVIPVYGTALSLPELAARIKTVFANDLKKTYELIFVNDCSPHADTAKKLDALLQADACVRVISLSKNYGQQAATLCGFSHSSGDYIITMDDDLQHWPENIADLIREQSHDVVIATFPDKKHTLKKRFFSKIKGYFDHLLLGKPKHIQLTSFRLINRVIVDAMLAMKSPYPFIPAQIFCITHDVVNVPVEHHERYDGRTTYTFLSMLRLFSNLMINNSSFLLNLLGRIGLAAAIMSFLAGSYYTFRAIYLDISVPGWTTLVVLILLFGGLLLFSVGVIGEYLVRMINTLEGKPSYVVRRARGFPDQFN